MLTNNQNIAEILSYHTTVNSDLVEKTQDNYPLDGKIAPRFHNEGETEAIILDVKIKPGEMFNLSATEIPMEGNINIIMPNGGKLVVIYNTIVEKKAC